ncbi:MAG TPA: cytochrome c [Burkholderiaceae bacterium]|nr:cytochrome c [Burkholderiaceae bacterium]HSB98380.1 cytochrome c [Burkholderiaceae bacterium]
MRAHVARMFSGLGLAAACVAAPAQNAPAPSRGQLLYTTHCVACHNSQVHWRDRRLATDWDTLKAQVQHWQARVLLTWSDDDIAEVTRYLNDAIYRFPQTSDRKG